MKPDEEKRKYRSGFLALNVCDSECSSNYFNSVQFYLYRTFNRRKISIQDINYTFKCISNEQTRGDDGKDKADVIRNLEGTHPYLGDTKRV